jgi:hypothetical protein
MSDDTVKTYLAENPRMLGVLFTLSILLTQVGNVAAGGNSGFSGP